MAVCLCFCGILCVLESIQTTLSIPYFKKKETLSLPDEPMNLQKNESCFSKSGAAPSYAILLND